MTEENKNPVGRPTDYKPEYCGQVHKLCLLGATDKEIANFFNIAVSTLNLWKIEYLEFSESIKSGKIIADAEVADKLYQRATGAEYTEEQAFKVKIGKDLEEIQIVKLTKHAPPDTAALSLWLRNRRKKNTTEKEPLEWNDKIIQQQEGNPENPVYTIFTPNLGKPQGEGNNTIE